MTTKNTLLRVSILLLLSGWHGMLIAQEDKGMPIDIHDAEYKHLAQQSQKSKIQGLPELYICGDSISVGYGPSLKQALLDKMSCVHRRDLDALFPDMVRPKNYSGLATSLIPLTSAVLESNDYKPDVLLLNCGLHDIARGRAKNKIAQYEKDLETIVALSRKHGVMLVWVQTTPKASGHSHNASIKRFNEVSARVMKERDVPIIDLHSFVMKAFESDGESAVISGDGVHFTPVTREKMGKYIGGELDRIFKDGTKDGE